MANGTSLLGRASTKLAELNQSAADARAAVELAKIGVPYLPWPASAIAPSALLSILNDMEINDRQHIVEFGCGLSTVYMAMIAKRTGAKIISFDDNPEWASLVRGWINRVDAAAACSIIVAPLTSNPHALDGNKWYDRTVVEAQLAGATVDLILVDGPIAYTQEKRLARYPALPNIADRLSCDCAIFLDDVRRSGEREIAERWAKEFGLTFEYHTSRGGYAKAVRGNAFYAAF